MKSSPTKGEFNPWNSNRENKDMDSLPRGYERTFPIARQGKEGKDYAWRRNPHKESGIHPSLGGWLTFPYDGLTGKTREITGQS